MLRAPFSLEKVTWNEKAKKVIYRSKRSWHTKQNFQVFTASDFIAATVEHIPPEKPTMPCRDSGTQSGEAKPNGRRRRRSQTIRYYGRYSNKRRGWDFKHSVRPPLMATLPKVEERKQPLRQPETLFILPAPELKSHRALRPLWRDLILKTWGEDPQRCPCCKGKMKNVGTIVRLEEIEFFLRLHGLWEPDPAEREEIDCRPAARRVERQRHQRIISLPPPPDPPFDIEKRRGIGGVLDVGEAEARRESPPGGAGESNREPLNVPIHWSWSDQTDPPPEDWWQDTPGEWEAPELPLDDGYTLVLDGDAPHEIADFPTFSVG